MSGIANAAQGARAEASKTGPPNRQSGYSAVRDDTSTVLIVAEAMHASAAADVSRLIDSLVETAAAWSCSPTTATLTRERPRLGLPSGEDVL